MKIYRKTVSIIILVSMLFILMCSTKNTFASSSLCSSNRNIANVAVMIYDFADPGALLLKQDLENIQINSPNTVKFTFFDGKNNIAIQNETLDALLKTNIDLFIINLADAKESIVEETIFKVKQKNVPLILIGIPLEVMSKVSKDYNKVAFVGLDAGKPAIVEGKILVDLWNSNKSAIDKNNDNIMQYVLLKGEVNSPIAIERTLNVLSTINNSNIKIQELASINSDWSREVAKDSIASLFLRYNGKIEAIIANNDEMALGAIEALQKYGYNQGDKSKNIAVVGIGGTLEAKDLVDKGLMTGTVIQDDKPFAEGIYNVGMNLVNGFSPIENTNYKIIDGKIIIPLDAKEYIKP